MTTLKFISGAWKHLVAEGFAPASSRKAAGLPVDWSHADGRKAHVVYGLLGRTAQSSIGTAWGYIVKMDEARA